MMHYNEKDDTELQYFNFLIHERAGLIQNAEETIGADQNIENRILKIEEKLRKAIKNLAELRLCPGPTALIGITEIKKIHPNYNYIYIENREWNEREFLERINTGTKRDRIRLFELETEMLENVRKRLIEMRCQHLKYKETLWDIKKRRFEAK